MRISLYRVLSIILSCEQFETQNDRISVGR